MARGICVFPPANLKGGGFLPLSMLETRTFCKQKARMKLTGNRTDGTIIICQIPPHTTMIVGIFRAQSMTLLPSQGTWKLSAVECYRQFCKPRLYFLLDKKKPFALVMHNYVISIFEWHSLQDGVSKPSLMYPSPSINILLQNASPCFSFYAPSSSIYLLSQPPERDGLT